MLEPSEFFDLSDPLVAELFGDCRYVWDLISKIGEHVARLVGDQQTILGEVMPGAFIGDAPIYIGEGAKVEPGPISKDPHGLDQEPLLGMGPLFEKTSS